jgi:MFS family permease
MSNFWLAATGIFFLGLCAGSVYVLGFTLLQEHTDDDMRGRIFATLLTVVRLCVLIALLMGPFLATIFNGFADAATGADPGEVPTVGALGFDLAIPGVRLTLWLAGLIILGAGVLSARSMKMGLREGLRTAIGTAERDDASRASHPTAIVVPPRPDLPAGGWTEPPPQIVLPPPYRGVSSGDLPPDVTGEIAPLDVPLARPRRRRGRGSSVDGDAS